MAKANFKSVEEYLTSQPETAQAILKRVRGIIRKALPDAEEVISYNIPTYKLDGQSIIYFAGWKNHYSLYPATSGVRSKFKDELTPYEVSKGTIRFPLSKSVPSRLIAGIAKLRAQEVAEHKKSAKKY